MKILSLLRIIPIISINNSNLQSALKSPPSTTGAAEETVGGSLNTAEKLVWLKCFKQWMSGEEQDDDDDKCNGDDDDDN